MTDILLVTMLLAVFVVGLFAINRLVRFMQEVHRATPGPQYNTKFVYIPPAQGTAAKDSYEEISKTLGPFSYDDEEEIIPLKTIDPQTLESLERSGGIIKFDN